MDKQIEIELDYKKITDIELDNIRMDDYPDFCDAFIQSATCGDRELTEEELDILNEDREYVHQKVWEYLY